MSVEKELVANLLKIRRITASHFPIGHSFIPYDILLTVLDFHINQKKLTVKNLFVVLPFSDMGLRYHFNRLLNSGWVELVKSETDSRIKEVVPSAKLLSNFSDVIIKLKK